MGDGDDRPMVTIGRLARVCGSPPKEGCMWRSFGDPTAVCPEHGTGRDQPDHPYRGTMPPTKEKR